MKKSKIKASKVSIKNTKCVFCRIQVGQNDPDLEGDDRADVGKVILTISRFIGMGRCSEFVGEMGGRGRLRLCGECLKIGRDIVSVDCEIKMLEQKVNGRLEQLLNISKSATATEVESSLEEMRFRDEFILKGTAKTNKKFSQLVLIKLDDKKRGVKAKWEQISYPKSLKLVKEENPVRAAATSLASESNFEEMSTEEVGSALLYEPLQLGVDDTASVVKSEVYSFGGFSPSPSDSFLFDDCDFQNNYEKVADGLPLKVELDESEEHTQVKDSTPRKRAKTRRLKNVVIKHTSSAYNSDGFTRPLVRTKRATLACPHCSRRFATEESLGAHLESDHIKINEADDFDSDGSLYCNTEAVAASADDVDTMMKDDDLKKINSGKRKTKFGFVRRTKPRAKKLTKASGRKLRMKT